jgi:hypothetical protein
VFEIFFTAELPGQVLYYTLDNAETLIDTGLIVISAAFIQAGKRNIDRSMVVAAADKTLNLIFI